MITLSKSIRRSAMNAAAAVSTFVVYYSVITLLDRGWHALTNFPAWIIKNVKNVDVPGALSLGLDMVKATRDAVNGTRGTRPALEGWSDVPADESPTAPPAQRAEGGNQLATFSDVGRVAPSLDTRILIVLVAFPIVLMIVFVFGTCIAARVGRAKRSDPVAFGPPVDLVAGSELRVARAALDRLDFKYRHAQLRLAKLRRASSSRYQKLKVNNLNLLLAHQRELERRRKQEREAETRVRAIATDLLTSAGLAGTAYAEVLKRASNPKAFGLHGPPCSYDTLHSGGVPWYIEQILALARLLASPCDPM